MTSNRATMKAIRLFAGEPGGSPTVSLVSLPRPEVTPGHLLVKVRASAIQPSDILNSKGSFALTTFPRVAGRDFAGTIEQGLAEHTGREVYGTSGNTHAFTEDGFHAEYCLVPQDAVAPKPKNISFAQAACIGVPFTTAALALRRANTTSTDSVLVLGVSGAVGSAVLQIARNMGCRVFGAGRNDSADINTSKDPELNHLMELTQNKGVSVVIDTVGQVALSQAALNRLARGGRFSFITAPRNGSTEMSFDMFSFYREEKNIVGCNSLLHSVQELDKSMAAMTADFESGGLKPAGESLWMKMGLDDAAEAYEMARTGKKVVIVMD